MQCQNYLKGGGIILDAGCGQGRYLNNLVEKYKDKEYYGMDLSSKALKSIKKKKPSVNVFEGSLTNIEKNDNFFDIVYCCEALEHAVDIEAAVCEMIRITKINGKIIIIDKPIYKLGVMPIGNWECWIDEKMIKNVAKKNKCDISIKKNVQYEGEWTDDLFHAWILTKNK